MLLQVKLFDNWVVPLRSSAAYRRSRRGRKLQEFFTCDSLRHWRPDEREQVGKFDQCQRGRRKGKNCWESWVSDQRPVMRKVWIVCRCERSGESPGIAHMCGLLYIIAPNETICELFFFFLCSFCLVCWLFSTFEAIEVFFSGLSKFLS